MTPNVTAFFDPATFTVSYVVREPDGSNCAIIDSVLDYDPAAGRTDTSSADAIIAFVKAENLTVTWILESHVHADHLSAAPYLQQQVGGKIGIGDQITVVQDTFGKVFNEGTAFQRDGSQFDALFKDGDSVNIGQMRVDVMHTPGHTPACLTYVIGDAAFVGDTLFMPDFGTARCDFPGGSAENLFNSIQKILALPDETRVFVGHDYKAPGRDEFAWETTIGEQKALNIHIGAGKPLEEFVSMRQERDATLGMPRLILPSIQTNMRAGQFPEPEDNGVRYLKVPVNTL
ncbi:MAG: MBL fold metallo-hydrolase [Loktanella sp.]|jgi:glyoxylase-like metal-dependent hydrolase (beta-lactamase superfamily II)|nr:MBL fold metallo-hydrolase [Yoonia sp.]MDO7557612.1 MBL fold metallo-hydrolase [Loktanella sp.]MDO7608519.1 MBL fold metallo-hydrolase [Loktanella sp.]MDO7623281.1 MBL fold metallo-hydrolase [Loktanella sp.]MDO7626436.1 MBL fold metallo-hydrolase [Loktanella sp.]